jgi:hypothetical protein
VRKFALQVDSKNTIICVLFSALEFSTAVAQLESVQQKLESNLSSNQNLLKETQKKFDNNTESLAENFKAMDERLKKLKK